MTILLTGEEWGDKKGTTAEVTLDTTGPRPHALLDGVLVCLEGCFAPNAAEVPYAIGQKVRLTGDKWPNPGAIEEVRRYWYSSAHHKWYPVLSSDYLVMEDWTVEAVEDEIERRMA